MIQTSSNQLPPSDQIFAQQSEGGAKVHGDKLLEREIFAEPQRTSTAATSTGPEFSSSLLSPTQRSATEEIKQMLRPSFPAQQLRNAETTCTTATTTTETAAPAPLDETAKLFGQSKTRVDLVTEAEPWGAVESLGFGGEPRRLFHIHHIREPVDPITETIHRGALLARRQKQLARPSSEIRELWEECKDFPEAFSASWVPLKQQQQQQPTAFTTLSFPQQQQQQQQVGAIMQPQMLQQPLFRTSGPEQVVRAQRIEERYKYTEERPIITEIASDSILKQYPNIQHALQQQQQQKQQQYLPQAVPAVTQQQVPLQQGAAIQWTPMIQQPALPSQSPTPQPIPQQQPLLTPQPQPQQHPISTDQQPAAEPWTKRLKKKVKAQK